MVTVGANMVDPNCITPFSVDYLNAVVGNAVARPGREMLTRDPDPDPVALQLNQVDFFVKMG